MRYSDMVKDAISSGKGEKAMWRSVSRVDELLRDIEVEHPDMYWQFMRKAHEDMYGQHYTPEYAEYDLSRLRYTDDGGIQRSGPHWTFNEVLSATSGRSFPEGTTDCDKWVAYNVAYSDFCKKFSDGDILDIAYLFFFDDDDAPDGKIWRYMKAMRM